MNVSVFSRFAIQNITHSKPYMLITIYGKGESIPNLLVDDNRFCIVDVKFEDITSPLDNYTIFNEGHALRVLSIINATRCFDLDIIVNCSAGISRSSAVAASILKIFTGDDSYIMENNRYRPNTYVYRIMIDTAFKMGLLS
jgi:predicted protein tyrosine phosphatase